MTRRIQAKAITGALFVVLGIVIAVRLFLGAGIILQAVPGYVFAGVMIALGCIRVADLRRARQAGSK